MNILVIAAHVDDAEIGCGGLIAKSVEEGAKVSVVSFSPCIESLPKGTSEQITSEEFKRSMKGLDVTNCALKTYPVRRLPEYRQDILDNIVEMNERTQPNLVITHNCKDPHQDHRCIAEQVITAFRHVSILSWETPRMSFLSHSNLFVPLTSAQLETKIKAVNCYASQKSKKNWKLTGEDSIRALAKVRGSACNSEFAEAYEVMKWIY